MGTSQCPISDRPSHIDWSPPNGDGAQFSHCPSLNYHDVSFFALTSSCTVPLPLPPSWSPIQASASELVIWAYGETEFCAGLLHQYVLSSAAAAGGLRLSAECVQIAVSHCSLLEDHGLAMAPVLLRSVRPSVEKALDANVKRIDDSVTAMAAADDWSMQPVPLNPRSPATRVHAGMPLANFKLSSSAYRLYSMVQVSRW